MITKTELRARMRAQRKALATTSPGAAQAAAAHAPALLRTLFPGGSEGRIAAVYAPIGSEIDTAPLAHAFEAAGLRLALPRAEVHGAPLRFHAWTPGDPLESDAAGCPAPLDLAAELDPDLIIVPLLAFDAGGGRLGQGGGHYDRTLEAVRASGRPVCFVGLAYAGQQAEELPVEAHDQLLDGVLTEVGYTPARRES